jgi:dTDP-4-amino-4,6-dideoxygalactose transaminase
MRYIQQAFDSNWISPFGPNIDGFEKDLENYLGEGVHVAAVSSGTAALHLALTMLGVERDDIVICQSFTFVASANPIVYLGAVPVFVDSEEDTWNICPDALETAIKFCLSKGKKPKAIIAVCLYGMPYKIEDIKKISEKYEIPVIEDSAEALGSTYKGNKCGTFGDISIFSFNGNKIITTSGGGALVLKNKKDKKKVIFLSNQAKDDAPHYQHSRVGYNYRLSNISAGIGRGQMEVLHERLIQKKGNHNFYQSVFSKIEEIKLFTEFNKDYKSNHWLNSITIEENNFGIDCKSVRLELSKMNIESRFLWKPMHLQPFFAKAKYFGTKVAENLFNSGLSLPSGTNLTDGDKEKIDNAFRQIFKKI